MKLVKDNAGVTLIELVVVMIISVIAMGLVGTILLSATGYFTKTTVADQDKLVLDKLAELVDGEITYATNVIVTEKDPEEIIKEGNNWHYFKFENGRLYIGQTKKDGRDELYKNTDPVEAFTEGYYENRKLYVSAKGFPDSYRLDLSYGLYDYNGESVYKTKSTISFPNLQIQFAKDKKGWFDSVAYESDQTGFYIYYNLESTSQKNNEFEQNSNSGTVAGQYNTCQKKSNLRGEWSNTLSPFTLGDFVYVMNSQNKKMWYRFVSFNDGNVSDNPATSRNEIWKHVYTEDSEPKEGVFDPDSNYFQGDIVRYFYYDGAETDFIYYYYKFYKFDYGYENLPNENHVKRWAPVYLNPYQSQIELCDIKNTTEDKTYVNSYLNHSFIYDSPFAKLYNKEHTLNPFKSGVVFYEYKDEVAASSKIIPTAIYNTKLQNDMVVKYKNEFYINLSTSSLNPGDVKPGELTSENERVWQKLQTRWDSKSVYIAGDIVLHNGNVYRCKYKDTAGTEPKEWTDGPWEKVYWNTNSKQYVVSD